MSECLHLLERVRRQNKLLRLNTKLWFAVQNNQFEKAEELLAQGATLCRITGAPLRRYDLDENTPLHIAARQGFLELVKLLIAHNIKIDISIKAVITMAI